MSPRLSPPTVAEFRRQATLLLRDLRSDDRVRREAAFHRFAILPALSHGDEPRERSVQRKHALNVIALEQGAPDWPALRMRIEPIETAELLYASGQMAAYWNIWFSTYEEARAVHREKGGYLFPYRNHFFVSDAHFVRAAGLDPNAPEWRTIGYDWARPGDRKAWARLAGVLRGKAAKFRQAAGRNPMTANPQAAALPS